jgi:hypothetical protein
VLLRRIGSQVGGQYSPSVRAGQVPQHGKWGTIQP